MLSTIDCGQIYYGEVIVEGKVRHHNLERFKPCTQIIQKFVKPSTSKLVCHSFIYDQQPSIHITALINT